MVADWQVLLQQEYRVVLAILILIVGGIAGYLLGRLNMRILKAAGLPEVVEGTPFERTARSLGTTTVSLIARLTSWFIYGVTILLALNTAELPLSTQLFWQIILFTPQLFVAALVFIVGFVVADKAELLVSERLRSVKLPEVNVIPRIVKYSIVYISSLIALSQIGIAVLTLLVLFGAYVAAAIVFGAVAFWDLLRSSRGGNLPPAQSTLRHRRRDSRRRQSGNRSGGRYVRHAHRKRRRGVHHPEPPRLPKRCGSTP